MTFSRKVRYPTNLAKYSIYHYLDSNHLYSRFREEKKCCGNLNQFLLKGWYVWYLLQEFLLLHTHQIFFT